MVEFGAAILVKDLWPFTKFPAKFLRYRHMMLDLKYSEPFLIQIIFLSSSYDLSGVILKKKFINAFGYIENIVRPCLS